MKMCNIIDQMEKDNGYNFRKTHKEEYAKYML